MTMRRTGGTKDWPADARVVLGEAHRRAREAAGWETQTAYAEASGISLRSITDLETQDGKSTVGKLVLRRTGEFLGRSLPGWTADTPRAILDGAPVPEIPAPPPDAVVAEELIDEMTEHVRLINRLLDGSALTRAEVDRLIATEDRLWRRRFGTDRAAWARARARIERETELHRYGP